MTATMYEYLLTDTANSLVDSTALASGIQESSIVTALDYINTDVTKIYVYMKDALSTGDETTLDSVIASHDGEPIEEVPEVKEPDGRASMHQTSRKRGLVTYFTARGDSTTDEGDVGNGTEILRGTHTIGDPASESATIYFNTMSNETHIHEGYLQWKDAINDNITLEFVPRVTPYTAGTNTGYTLYGGYLVLPAAGDGTVTIADADRKLVLVPLNEDGHQIGAGYWDATWNSTTKEFESVTANPYGTGRFNMFTVPVTLDRFVNKQCILGSGFMMLQTSDASMIGHNMGIKITVETVGADHDFTWNASLVCHRKRTQ